MHDILQHLCNIANKYFDGNWDELAKQQIVVYWNGNDVCKGGPQGAAIKLPMSDEMAERCIQAAQMFQSLPFVCFVGASQEAHRCPSPGP